MPIDASPSGTLDIENATLRSRNIASLTNMVAGNDVIRGSAAPTLEVYGDPSHGGSEPTLELVSNTSNTVSTTFTRLTSNAGVFSIQSGTAGTADSKADITFASIGGNTEHMRIKGSTGRVGIGTDDPSSPLHVVGTARADTFNIDGNVMYLDRKNAGNGVSMTSYDDISFYVSGTSGAESGTRAFNINGNGNVGIGITNPPETLTVQHPVISPTFGLRRGSYGDYVVYMKNTAGNFTTVNTSQDCVINVGKGTGTNRSINALGTVNASGTDYAEYMKKSRTDLVINKGDIVGINNDAELTNVFSESIQFVVKSTNPSYVGGDTWKQGTVNSPEYPSVLLTVDEYSNISSQDATLYSYWEEQNMYANTEQLNTFYEENEKYLEDKNIHREPYDRIAFCGQVPVNVYNAVPGQYIIPTQTDDDTISYELTNTPTFEQYRVSIGKVVKIEEDGRAFIIVKIS